MDAISTESKIPPDILLPLNFGIYEDSAPQIGPGHHFSMLFLDRGVSIATINGNRYVLDASGVLYLCHQDRLTLDWREGFRCIVIQFDPKFIHDDFSIDRLMAEKSLSLKAHADYYLIRPFFVKDASFYGYLPVGPGSHQKIAGCFNGLVNELAHKQRNRNECICWSRSFLVETLILAARMFYNRKHMLMQPEPIMAESIETLPEKIILFLHSSYQNKITLRNLCDRFAINRTSLSNLVKKFSGMTVIGYLNKLRVSQACMLLMDSDRTISEICYQTGFSDPSHFGRTFKKIVGMAPSRYRSEYKLPSVG